VVPKQLNALAERIETGKEFQIVGADVDLPKERELKRILLKRIFL